MTQLQWFTPDELLPDPETTVLICYYDEITNVIEGIGKIDVVIGKRGTSIQRWSAYSSLANPYRQYDINHDSVLCWAAIHVPDEARIEMQKHIAQFKATQENR